MDGTVTMLVTQDDGTELSEVVGYVTITSTEQLRELLDSVGIDTEETE